MLRARLLLPILPLSALVACGGPLRTTPDDKRPVQQARTDVAFADQYLVDDLACQTGSGNSRVGSVPLTFWQQGASRETPFAFQGTTSADSLVGPGIKDTFYDFYQTQACGTVGDDASCATANVVQQIKQLRICRPDGPFPRTSVEGVALTSLANISVAYAFYQTLPNRVPSLAQSHLLVLPTVEKTYEGGTKRSVSTDNLAYAPSFGGEPVFVIYPKGAHAAQQGLWKNLNLWELPWGLAHEFGHHVFRTHTQIASLGDGLEAVLPIHSYNDPTLQEGDLAGRSVNGDDVFGAVNEGYADLYAFYVYGAKPGLTTNVDCFEGNREVSQATFATGQKKALTAAVLATFFASARASTPDCKTPNFQDIHAIGAIFAHAVNRIFAAVQPDAVGRAQLQLKWAERMGDTARAKGKAQLTFDLLAKDALLAAATGGALPAAACAAAREAFPEYADAWFAAGADLRCQ